MTTQPKVWPADVYDAMEFSVLAYGGVGRGNWFKGEDPCCAQGHAMVADIPDPLGIIDTAENDAAVTAINVRKHLPWDTRVLWEEYCAELNIVRSSK